MFPKFHLSGYIEVVYFRATAVVIINAATVQTFIFSRSKMGRNLKVNFENTEAGGLKSSDTERHAVSFEHSCKEIH